MSNGSPAVAPFSKAQSGYINNFLRELFPALREISLKKVLTNDVQVYWVEVIEEVLKARTQRAQHRVLQAKIDLVRSFVRPNGRPYRVTVEETEAAIADGTIPEIFVQVPNSRFLRPIDPAYMLNKIGQAEDLVAKFRAGLESRAGSDQEESGGEDEASGGGADRPPAEQAV